MGITVSVTGEASLGRYWEMGIPMIRQHDERMMRKSFRPALKTGQLMSRRRIVKTISWIAGLVILLLSFFVPVQYRNGWIDPVTGARKHQTDLTFSFDMKPFFKTTPIIQSSALADWLARREGGVTYQWRYSSGALQTVWGMSLGYSDGDSLFMRRLSLNQIEDFVKSSSDDELGHFVDIMRHGTKEKQEVAVEAAVTKALAAKYPDASGSH